MTKKQCGGYLDEIQENVDGDLLREMVRVIVQSVMEQVIDASPHVRIVCVNSKEA